MTDVQYIGMDVHQASISIAVLDGGGALLMQSTIRTQACTLREFLRGLEGTLYVTFEEGTWSAWLYDLLSPHVTQAIACDPRHNAWLKSGNKSDKIDARRLAELLRAGMLKPVYHGQRNAHRLKELSRSYLTLVHDSPRVMNRIKAIYRSQGIPAVPASGFIRSATVSTGWSNCANQAYVSEPHYSISNSMEYRLCESKRVALYWPRAANIRPTGFF